MVACTSKVRRLLFSESSMLETVAVEHTCPDTLWPPISSPTLAERSKFTLAPICRVPRLVARSVSMMMSKLSLSPCASVTWYMPHAVTRQVQCARRNPLFLMRSALTAALDHQSFVALKSSLLL